MLLQGILQYIPRKELLNSARLVDSTFNHIIQHPLHFDLQCHLWRTSLAVANKIEKGGIVRIHPSLTDDMPYRLGRCFYHPFEEIPYSVGARSVAWHSLPFMNDDMSDPPMESATLYLSMLESQVIASRLGRGLSVKDVAKGLIALLQNSKGSELLADSIKSNSCGRFSVRHQPGSFKAQAYGEAVDEIDVNVCNVADIAHLYQTWWCWRALTVEMNSEGVVVLDWGRDFKLHFNCREDCDASVQRVPPVIWVDRRVAQD